MDTTRKGKNNCNVCEHCCTKSVQGLLLFIWFFSLAARSWYFRTFDTNTLARNPNYIWKYFNIITKEGRFPSEHTASTWSVVNYLSREKWNKCTFMFNILYCPVPSSSNFCGTSKINIIIPLSVGRFMSDDVCIYGFWTQRKAGKVCCLFVFVYILYKYNCWINVSWSSILELIAFSFSNG